MNAELRAPNRGASFCRTGQKPASRYRLSYRRKRASPDARDPIGSAGIRTVDRSPHARDKLRDHDLRGRKPGEPDAIQHQQEREPTLMTAGEHGWIGSPATCHRHTAVDNCADRMTPANCVTI